MLGQFVEDVCGGVGQKPAQAALGEFARGGGDEDEPTGLDRSSAGWATKVGQGHHAAHGMSGKGKGACDAEGCEHVGEVGGESVEVVAVHRSGRRVAVAAVVVADDPDAVAVLM